MQMGWAMHSIRLQELYEAARTGTLRRRFGASQWFHWGEGGGVIFKKGKVDQEIPAPFRIFQGGFMFGKQELNGGRCNAKDLRWPFYGFFWF